MDEKVRELLEQSLFERAQIAFAQMRQADPRLNGLVEEVIALSEEVEHYAGMDVNARDLVQRFLSKSADMDSEFQKYLYIQGARDCVAMLRELGVIK